MLSGPGMHVAAGYALLQRRDLFHGSRFISVVSLPHMHAGGGFRWTSGAGCAASRVKNLGRSRSGFWKWCIIGNGARFGFTGVQSLALLRTHPCVNRLRLFVTSAYRYRY